MLQVPLDQLACAAALVALAQPALLLGHEVSLDQLVHKAILDQLA